MYNIYSIVILILFDIPRFSVNDLHQIQVAAPSPSSRKSTIKVEARGRVSDGGHTPSCIHKYTSLSKPGVWGVRVSISERGGVLEIVRRLQKELARLAVDIKLIALIAMPSWVYISTEASATMKAEMAREKSTKK